MDLLLRRKALRDTYTIGGLYINGVYFCDTLENKVREGVDGSFVKVPGSTAIPRGRYEVTLGIQSPRFRTYKQYAFCDGLLPRLLGVPHFEGILIHIGNTSKDTDGCILVGENTAVGMVLNSTATFKRLYARLQEAADVGERIFIEVC